MRAIWRWSLLMGWLVCSGAMASALDTLRQCAVDTTPEVEGLPALNARCPGLDAALNELTLTDNLTEDLRGRLNRDGLLDLEAMARRYHDNPTDHGPGVSALAGILKDMAAEQRHASKSWWDAVKEWLRSWLDGSRDKDSDSWLSQLLKSLKPSELALSVLLYALLSLVVISAVAVVFNELRAAGLLTRGGRTIGRAPKVAFVSAEGNAVLSIADLEEAALRDRPAILLKLLVARLLASQRLKTERSLTHRELSRHGEFASSQQRESFAAVATLAEQLLYGSALHVPEQITRVVAEGHALLQQIGPGKTDQRSAP